MPVRFQYYPILSQMHARFSVLYFTNGYGRSSAHARPYNVTSCFPDSRQNIWSEFIVVIEMPVSKSFPSLAVCFFTDNPLLFTFALVGAFGNFVQFSPYITVALWAIFGLPGGRIYLKLVRKI